MGSGYRFWTMLIAPWSRPSRFRIHLDPLPSASPFSATTRVAPPTGYSKLLPCELCFLQKTPLGRLSDLSELLRLPQSLSSVAPASAPEDLGPSVTLPNVPTRSDMQRWLGAFPTPGPLPCSPDTIYEDCGEYPPRWEEGRKSES